ncbi:MAG TPA: hypothetical protein VK994_08280 [Bacteroidales bacterium]|nr:hypothetical protein [Bacteroidales bacterium]
MDKIRKAVRIMTLVRIAALVLLLAAVILYFTYPAYAMYPAIIGFAMIALINLPLNFWINRRQRKEEIRKFEAEDKAKK